MDEVADAKRGNRAGKVAERTWHDERAQEVCAALATSLHGLATEDAASRLDAHGPNALPAPPARHPVLRFLAQFNNTLICFLLAAAVAAWILGHRIDAAVIIAVITISAIVGFLQEDKAEKACLLWKERRSSCATSALSGARSHSGVRDCRSGKGGKP